MCACCCACPIPGVGIAPGLDHEALREQDGAFQHAMMRAIQRGRERPPKIGVYRDNRPIGQVPPIAASPLSSGVGSPAEAVAKVG
jgi:hypothetical protein